MSEKPKIPCSYTPEERKRLDELMRNSVQAEEEIGIDELEEYAAKLKRRKLEETKRPWWIVDYPNYFGSRGTTTGRLSTCEPEIQNITIRRKKDGDGE